MSMMDETFRNTVFVGGGWKFKDDAMEMIRNLEGIGYTVKSGFLSPILYQPDSYTTMEACALYNFNAIDESCYAVFLMDDPDYPYAGSFAELAYALAKNKFVTVVSSGFDTSFTESQTYACCSNVFVWHPKVTRLSNSSALYTLMAELKHAIDKIHNKMMQSES